MLFLRQSTASQEILLGPFVDSTDGNTQETALTINNTDIKLWKEGGTTEASKNSGGATHIASGRYYAVLDATDTDTVGKLEVNVHVTGALAVRREFMVLEEAVYDSLFASSAAGYQVPIWASAGSTVSLTGTTVATVTTTTTATNVTTVNGLAANVITATSIAADAITAAKIATGAIDADALATDAVAEIADGVWDEVLSGHLTAGSTGNALNAAGSAGDPWSTSLPGAYGAGTAGKIIGDNINATISSRASQTSVDTVDDFLDTEIAAIKAQTDLIPASPASTTNITAATGITVSAIGAGVITAASIATGAIDADALAADAVAEIADGVWDEARSGHVSAGSFGEGVASVQGNVTGSVASVTGAVGSVTGAVGSVTGAVGSVTGNVGGNVVGSVASVTGAVGSVTGNVGGNVTGSIGSLGATAKSDVNAEVLDVLATDTFAEPGAVPAATSTLKDKINWLFALARNKITQTSTTQTLRNDADSGNIATSTVSDDGTTFTRGEYS